MVYGHARKAFLEVVLVAFLCGLVCPGFGAEKRVLRYDPSASGFQASSEMSIDEDQAGATQVYLPASNVPNTSGSLYLADGLGGYAANVTYDSSGTSDTLGAVSWVQDALGAVASHLAATPTTYLKLDATNDPVTGALELSSDLTVTGALLSPGSGGSTSLKAGLNALASNSAAVALGYGATASGAAASAQGSAAIASGNLSTAIGSDAVASGQESLALGVESNASGTASVSLGSGSAALHDYSIVMGHGASSTQMRQIRLGDSSYTVAIDGLMTETAGDNFIDLRDGTGRVALAWDGAGILFVGNAAVDVAGTMTATGAVTGSNLSGTNTGDQSLWATVTGNTGSTTANAATDTLAVVGGSGISTAVSGDTLTITNTGGAGGSQYLWETIVADTGSTTASTTTDTLTIAGGTGISTAIVGDTLTITNAGGVDAATLDGLDSLQFLRADVADTAAGEIDFPAGIEVDSIQNLAGTIGAVFDSSPANFDVKYDLTVRSDATIVSNLTVGGVIDVNGTGAHDIAGPLTVGDGVGTDLAVRDDATVGGDLTVTGTVTAGQPYCLLTNNGVQSIPNSTFTAVTFDTEEADVWGMHSTVSNTSRVTPTVAGTYLVEFDSRFSSIASGTYVLCFVAKNGVTTARRAGRTGFIAGALTLLDFCTGPTTFDLNGTTDYIEVLVWQNSGAANNLGSATDGAASYTKVSKVF